MATTMNDLRHDHAGLRWIVPFTAIFAALLVMMIVMLVYPHL
jgi:hypothetical protein